MSCVFSLMCICANDNDNKLFKKSKILFILLRLDIVLDIRTPNIADKQRDLRASIIVVLPGGGVVDACEDGDSALKGRGVLESLTGSGDNDPRPCGLNLLSKEGSRSK